MFSEATVAVDDVIDRCFVTCGEDLNCSVEEYTARGINYFYFLEVKIFSRKLFSRELLLSTNTGFFFLSIRPTTVKQKSSKNLQLSRETLQ